MLTDSQRHYIQNLLRHVEHEAQDGIATLQGDDPEALFPRYTGYPDARRIGLLRTHLTRLRSAMRRFMESHGMASATQDTVDAAWGFQTRMTMARNAVFELRPSYMRGYGELDAQGEQDCRALAAELGLLLDDIARELRRAPLRLPADQTKDALLTTLVEVIERHQLLELRSRAERLLAGQDESRIEIAMLGRVSSGKSSLINALLEQPLLPVGAVPVTAVVTRLRHGKALNIRTIDVEGRVEEVKPEDLPGYIAESGNPDNRLRLREVAIEVPAPVLHGGVSLTDTPGLGSLHARASAHALTYLPQCDLGIVTIDASATLAQQDVDLLRALKQAHASWLVVMTKCDSVSAQALAEQRVYIERSLSSALDEPVTVASVSIAPAHEGSLRDWRHGAFREALEVCAKRSQERRRQRLGDLARRVLISLEQALRESPATPSAARSSGTRLAALSDTERRLGGLCSDLSQLGADTVLRDALPAIVAGGTDPTSHIGALAAQLADEVVRDMVKGLKQVAGDIDPAQLAATLRGAPPFVQPALSPLQVSIVRGPRAWRRHVWRRRLQREMHAALQKAFQAYAHELRAWLTQACQALRRMLGSDVLADHVADGDSGTLRQDIERIRAQWPTLT